jgi:hypothetical protein
MSNVSTKTAIRVGIDGRILMHYDMRGLARRKTSRSQIRRLAVLYQELYRYTLDCLRFFLMGADPRRHDWDWAKAVQARRRLTEGRNAKGFLTLQYTFQQGNEFC